MYCVCWSEAVSQLVRRTLDDGQVDHTDKSLASTKDTQEIRHNNPMLGQLRGHWSNVETTLD